MKAEDFHYHFLILLTLIVWDLNCLYQNVFGVVQFLQHATSSTECPPLFLMERHLTPSYSLLLQSSLCILEFLDVLVMSTALA